MTSQLSLDLAAPKRRPTSSAGPQSRNPVEGAECKADTFVAPSHAPAPPVAASLAAGDGPARETFLALKRLANALQSGDSSPADPNERISRERERRALWETIRSASTRKRFRNNEVHESIPR